MTQTSVERPSLPPSMWVAVSLAAGVWAAEACGWAGVPAWAGIVAACASCACGWMVARGLGRMLAAGFLMGVVAATLLYAQVDAAAARLAGRDSMRLEGTVITDPSVGRSGARSEVRIRHPVDAVVEVSWPGSAPEAGQRVVVWGRSGGPERDDWARRRHRRGVAITLRARALQVKGWGTGVRGVIGSWRQAGVSRIARSCGPAAALVSAVSLGERSGLVGTQADSDFRLTGLTHLIAVSGSHLVVVAALLDWLLRAIGTSRGTRVAGVTMLAGAYVIGTGLQASAVRAWMMALCVSTATLGGRRSHAPAALAGACVLAVVLDPSVVFDLGFQLSVTAVAGLVVFGGFAAEWVSAMLPSRMRWLAEPVSMTLVAQWATLPITSAVFSTVSLVAPVANLLVGPLISAVLTSALAGLALSPAPVVGTVLLKVASVCASAATEVAGYLASVPYAAMPLGASGVIIGAVTLVTATFVWTVWPRPRKGPAIAVALTIVVTSVIALAGPRPASGTSLVVLDVGQGDATLVRDGSRCVLIDTGPDAPALADALRRQRVLRLDAVVLTHMHSDHIGGVKAIAGLIPVKQVFVGEGATPRQYADYARIGTVTTLRAGSQVSLGDFAIDVVAPSGDVDDAASNEASIVMVVRAHGFDALLTGDAEAEVLDPLVRSGALGDVDILKVGHHGSADAVSEQGLAALKPEYAVISVGKENRYGHPAPSTLRLLAERGCRVIRTDIDGDIAFTIDSDGYAAMTP